MIAPFTSSGSISETGALIAAPLIGVGFGWFLERGGLGNAPKLAAQFYLTDLRVFKVMFSALLTAMIGAFWLDRLGLLDLSLVSLPDTFLVPQAVGGVLFGAGFLIAGLCPGTTCVAAATGRVDGLGVLGGLFAGVIFFDLNYGRLEHFYLSTPREGFTLPHLIGASEGVTVAIITVVALAGFVLAERIERSRA